MMFGYPLIQVIHFLSIAGTILFIVGVFVPIVFDVRNEDGDSLFEEWKNKIQVDEESDDD